MADQRAEIIRLLELLGIAQEWYVIKPLLGEIRCSRKPSLRLPGWHSSENQDGSWTNVRLPDMQATAKALGLKLLSLEVRSLDDFENAFAQAKRDGVQALFTATGGLISTQRRS